MTQRVEAAIRGINGVDEIQSTAREGSSTTFVQFDMGTPVDRAVNDVRDAIANVRSDLPDGILEPQVERVEADGGPIAYMAVESTAMGLEELSWYIDNTITQAPARHSRHGQRLARRRGQPRDPDHPRSGQDAGPRHHRRPGQRPASPDQRQRRRRPGRDRRLRAIGAGARQCRRRPRPRREEHLGRQRADDQALLDRHGPRPLCRAAQRRADERPAGAELLDREGQGILRRHRLGGGRGGDEEAREGERRQDHLPAAVHQRQIYRGPVSQRHGGPGRGRGPRGSRRPPLPSRLAGDPDLGRRHPALGHPDLLVHGHDGLHAERRDPARAQPRRGRSGRRRDRRDREYRQAHANGQIGLSGVDRRRRRDRPRGRRHHLLDRRRVPPGRDDGRPDRPVFQELRNDDRRRGADQPCSSRV